MNLKKRCTFIIAFLLLFTVVKLKDLLVENSEKPNPSNHKQFQRNLRSLSDPCEADTLVSSANGFLKLKCNISSFNVRDYYILFLEIFDKHKNYC